MVKMSLSSELLSIAVLVLANNQTGCAWGGTTARSSHPKMVLKWTAGGDGRAGS
jgi:hypothetical protein